MAATCSGCMPTSVTAIPSSSVFCVFSMNIKIGIFLLASNSSIIFRTSSSFSMEIRRESRPTSGSWNLRSINPGSASQISDIFESSVRKLADLSIETNRASSALLLGKKNDYVHKLETSGEIMLYQNNTTAFFITDYGFEAIMEHTGYDRNHNTVESFDQATSILRCHVCAHNTFAEAHAGTNVSKTYNRTSFCGTNVYGSQLACPLICFELTQMMRSKKHHSKIDFLMVAMKPISAMKIKMESFDEKSKDFNTWGLKMQSLLVQEGLREEMKDYRMWQIETGYSIPSHVVDEVRTDIPFSQWNRVDQINAQLNAKCLNCFFCALDYDDFVRVSTCSTGKEIWDTLYSTYEGTMLTCNDKRTHDPTTSPTVPTEPTISHNRSNRPHSRDKTNRSLSCTEDRTHREKNREKKKHRETEELRGDFGSLPQTYEADVEPKAGQTPTIRRLRSQPRPVLASLPRRLQHHRPPFQTRRTTPASTCSGQSGTIVLKVEDLAGNDLVDGEKEDCFGVKGPGSLPSSGGKKRSQVLCLTGLVERFVKASPPCCGSKRRVTTVFSAILGGEAPGSGRRSG
ncbi:hypothetical protein M5K25_014597 [Dendrobium thyrsiflorum]|uniref:Uncharacterized protein n=1 Tax=Dendrobium thyrsiflorum TaxID=117978 RepID=A0ABD0UN60_DENTH